MDKVSLRALSEYNTSLLTSLIDINRNIAAGLSVKPEGETADSGAAPAAQGGGSFSASA